MIFEDDGASFRIRRQQQLDQMFQRERVVVIDGRTGRVETRSVPKVIKLVFWPIGVAGMLFLAVLAFCIVDFILWSFGLPV